jgi:hypothetical protein
MRDRYEVQQLKTVPKQRKYIGVYAIAHIKPWFSYPSCYIIVYIIHMFHTSSLYVSGQE